MRHEFWQFPHQAKTLFLSLKRPLIQSSPWMTVTLTHQSASHLLGELIWNQAVVQDKFKYPLACFWREVRQKTGGLYLPALVTSSTSGGWINK